VGHLARGRCQLDSADSAAVMQGSLMIVVLLLVAPLCALSTESAAIQRVITMLDNLVAELEAESQADETQHGEYINWADNEITTTTADVERLNGQIQETNAILSSLRSQQAILQDSVNSLQGQIDQEQNQVNVATDRRNTEHTNYVSEQANFVAAIAACGRATEILAAHYGDGAPEPAQKPAWMSALLSEQMSNVRQAVAPLHGSSRATGSLQQFDDMSLIQTADRHSQTHGNKQHQKIKIGANPYQDSGGEATGIVDQIRALGSSFSDDKQSAVDDEERLLGLYGRLMEEKTVLLNQLRTERDDQQSRLTTTNQEIAEEEGELQRAEKDLGDSQAYLSLTQGQKATSISSYQIRQHDRKAETEAVNLAVGVLDKYKSASLMQLDSSVVVAHRGKYKHKGKHQAHHRHLRNGHRHTRKCGDQCHKAASLLRQKASVMHSQLLQAAATAADGVTSLNDVVSSLQGIVQQLEHEQDAEEKHKDWCEDQTHTTNSHISEHSSIVTQLTAVLANLDEVLAEKNDALVSNQQSIDAENQAFKDLEHLREEGKDEYTKNHEETVEAITALNQAIDILAKFYSSVALVQQQNPAIAATDPQSGKQVVSMITEVRDEFEAARSHLEEVEAQDEKDFQAARTLHQSVGANLGQERNTLLVEKQTAEQGISTNTEDKGTEQEAVRNAQQYLSRVKSSCGPLIENFERRTQLRENEKSALEDAVKVLKEQ